MPWNEPGGDNQKDPWTGKNKNSGGSGNSRADAEELLNKLNQKIGGLFGGNRNSSSGDSGPANYKGIFILLGLLVVGWLFSGFYMVDAREEALVMRFGAYKTTTGPGLHWHLPAPLESIEVIDVAQNRSAQDESTMLTKDENIVKISVTAQYQVSNARDYAFNVARPDDLRNQENGTLYQAMRSATRETVGRNEMDYILGEGREQIALETQKLLQTVLDRYEIGIKVIKINLTYAEAPDQVKDAFDDANRAREDANRFQNEAETYANKVLPEARGKAARILEEATAYRDQLIARAEGDASRFSQLVTEYRKAPDVTRERLYLETMETVMSGTRKVLIDSENSNNLLYLPINSNDSSDSLSVPPPAAMAAQGIVNQNSTAFPSGENGRQQRDLTPGQQREARQ